MIDLSKKPTMLKNLLNYLGQEDETEVIYEYYGYGQLTRRQKVKIKDLPRQVTHYGKCFEISWDGTTPVYKVEAMI